MSGEELAPGCGSNNRFSMLNGAQLDAENPARYVETRAKTFSEPDAPVKSRRSMDVYIGKSSEYEDSRRRFSGDELALPLLEGFLRSARVSKFMPQMTPHDEVQQGIRRRPCCLQSFLG